MTQKCFDESWNNIDQYWKKVRILLSRLTLFNLSSGCISLALKDEMLDSLLGNLRGKAIQTQKKTLTSTLDKTFVTPKDIPSPKLAIKDPGATDELDPMPEQDLIIA
jgi:hypothetical protein